MVTSSPIMSDLYGPVYGLVLSGGRSERMGRDKASLVYEQQPQLERSVHLLQTCCTEVYVSARADQQDQLRSRWPIIVDQVSNIGPLAGIAAAQATHAEVAWLVVACDLPLLDAITLTQLVANRSPNHQAVAITLSDASSLEPLCALWEPSSRGAIQIAIEQQQYSVRQLLQRLNTYVIAAAQPRALCNINTPDDYRALMAS